MKIKLGSFAILSMGLALTMTTSAFADGGRMGKGGHHRMGMERPAFSEIDTNGDGQITTDEITAMEAARFSQMDLDGNGEITAEEFAAKHQKDNADRAARMLERFDADKSGGLSMSELPKRGDDGDRASRMIEHLDTNGDGQISEAEYDAAPKRGDRGPKPDQTSAPATQDNASGESSL